MDWELIIEDGITETQFPGDQFSFLPTLERNARKEAKSQESNTHLKLNSLEMNNKTLPLESETQNSLKTDSQISTQQPKQLKFPSNQTKKT